MIVILPILWFLYSGFYDKGKKTLASVFLSAFLGGVCALFFVKLNWYYVLYFFLAWYILEIIYNIIRKLGWFYVGTTKLTDKLLRIICDKTPVLKYFTRGHYAHASFMLKLFAATGIFALFYTHKL